MKNETNQPKKTRLKGFYTALLISLAMIGAACAYAYQAATSTLEENINSLQNDITAATQTTAVSNTETNTETLSASTSYQVYDAAADVKPEAADETEIQAETEDVTETVQEEEFDHVLVMPIEGEIQEEFSNGELVKSETTGTWQTHNGTDIAAEKGSAVCVIDNGTVLEVAKDALWGVCITVDHGNGIVSRYCGLSASLSVTEGDEVESGQIIGSVGDTADIESKQEPHLHFEVLKNNIYVDPIKFLNE